MISRQATSSTHFEVHEIHSGYCDKCEQAEVETQASTIPEDGGACWWLSSGPIARINDREEHTRSDSVPSFYNQYSLLIQCFRRHRSQRRNGNLNMCYYTETAGYTRRTVYAVTSYDI
jgi:hypothetical protein